MSKHPATGWLTISEVQSVIIMAGHGSMQADMVLEKELRVLRFDPQEAGSDPCHWAQLEHRRPQNLPPTVTYFLKHKAIPTPTKSHLLIVPLPMSYGCQLQSKLPQYHTLCRIWRE